ncbi:hypothetical protein [Flocculibacter collagenilyticus]|uniref:hypothetical protein n=1 Tax=Flocculibacter collagenilyticus TaxID=2744479 RepID=UPI0018F6BFA2|nr:hypothetical protein [Flocculibacter collagenilyticus]
MSNDKAKELMDAYQEDKREKLLLEIESLKPSKYGWVVNAILIAVAVILVQLYVQEDSILLEPKLILLMLVIYMFSGSNTDRAIHKRIDALVELINTKNDKENSKQ